MYNPDFEAGIVDNSRDIKELKEKLDALLKYLNLICTETDIKAHKEYTYTKRG